MPLEGLRIALVHDWLTGLRGGEKVLDCLAELFPQARLFTLLKTCALTPNIEALPCSVSPVQRLPFLRRLYRHYLPLFPLAVESFDLSDFDLVISLSHCVAKGARPAPGALHLGYVFTPMRYVWDLYPLYFGPGRNPLVRLGMKPVRRYLQRWDRRSCGRVDRLACISAHVAERIRRHWGRPAEIIHPPVETARFRIGPAGDYYLIVSALAPYKGIDLAIRAANQAGFKLVVAGDGQEMNRLRSLAGPSVSLLGWVDDEALVELYANCRAFIFPGEEDFGLTPLEAMASGKPVIALGRGGALESIAPLNPAGPAPPGPPGGVFFYQDRPEALLEALELFESRTREFDPQALRVWAKTFDRALFLERFLDFVKRALKERRGPAF